MINTQKQIQNTLKQFYDKPVAKVSLELFFTAIAVVFFAVFAIRPTLLTMSKLIKEMEDKQVLNQKLAEKVASLSTLQSTYITNQERLGVLDEAIPPTPQFETALAIIEKVASENNLTISSIEAKQVPQETDPDVLFSRKSRVSRPVVVILDGKYLVIRKFIEDLKAVRRVFTVDSILFNKVEQVGEKGLQATVTLNIPYYDLEAANATTSADPAQPVETK